MRSNTIAATILTALVVTHVGSLISVWCSPRGLSFLLALNATCAVTILLYIASRTPYLIAAKDWLMLGFLIFEVAVLSAAIFAFRDHRIATIGSYVAFGLHACATLAAVVFAFTFKITRLI